MNTTANNLRAKGNKVQILTINEKKMYETIRKRKNQSAHKIDGKSLKEDGGYYLGFKRRLNNLRRHQRG